MLYEERASGAYESAEPLTLATTDFVLSGGAGYGMFRGLETAPKTQHLRDAIAQRMTAAGRLDPSRFARGRYVNRHGR